MHVYSPGAIGHLVLLPAEPSSPVPVFAASDVWTEPGCFHRALQKPNTSLGERTDRQPTRYRILRPLRDACARSKYISYRKTLLYPGCNVQTSYSMGALSLVGFQLHCNALINVDIMANSAANPCEILHLVPPRRKEARR